VKPIDRQILARVATGAHHDPHAVLGAHPHAGSITIRTLRPLARTVEVLLPDGAVHPMVHEWDGIWCTVIPGSTGTDYRDCGSSTTAVCPPWRTSRTLLPHSPTRSTST
jgi:1,4-alpha-glucan branching enzyme